MKLGVKINSGECDAQGQWLSGKQPAGQCYAQRIEVGKYRVVHNCGKIQDVGVELLKPGIASIHSGDNDSISIDIFEDFVTPMDCGFRIFLSEPSCG